MTVAALLIAALLRLGDCSGGSSPPISVWTDPSAVKVTKIGEAAVSTPYGMLGAIVAPDMSFAVTVSQIAHNQAVTVIELPSGNIRQSMPLNGRYMNGDLHSDGTWGIFCDADGVWKISMNPTCAQTACTKDEVGTEKNRDTPFYGKTGSGQCHNVEFAPDGSYAMYIDKFNKVGLMDTSQGFATPNNGRVLPPWVMGNGNCDKTNPTPIGTEACGTSLCFSGAIHDFVFTSDGLYGYFNDNKGRIYKANTSTWCATPFYQPRSNWVYEYGERGLEISPDNSYLLGLSDGRPMSVMDLNPADGVYAWQHSAFTVYRSTSHLPTSTAQAGDQVSLGDRHSGMGLSADGTFAIVAYNRGDIAIVEPDLSNWKPNVVRA